LGELKKWRNQNWVRIGTAKSLSKRERSKTARKKKASGGKTQFVPNTKKAKVTK